MIGQLIYNDMIRIKRYVETNVKGRVHKTLVYDSSVRAAVMPVSPGEMSDIVAEISKLETSGRRITDYKQVFSKSKIHLHDEIEVNGVAIPYIVLKYYDYSRFGINAGHEKAVIVRIED